jgi:GxxExxY protein
MAEYQNDKIERIASEVVDAAYKIHTKLGRGLLESLYVKVLVRELESRGFAVKTEVPVNVYWEDEDMGVGFRADIVVDDCVVIEVKASEGVARLHAKQLLTYIRLMGLRLGILINFNHRTIKQGIKRVIDDYDPNAQVEPNTI